MRDRPSGLRDQVLLAALECCAGSVEERFTAEDLLVAAWKHTPHAWGLRGYEREYPDAEKMYKELRSRGKSESDVIARGFLERLEPLVFRLTPAGLAAASELDPDNHDARERANRQLELAVRRIIEHPVFVQWLVDRQSVTRFRDAGHFWGIAPGTPTRVVRERVRSVEQLLDQADHALNERGVDEMYVSGGRAAFDRRDLQRAREFQAALKEFFAKDLKLLGY